MTKEEPSSDFSGEHSGGADGGGWYSYGYNGQTHRGSSYPDGRGNYQMRRSQSQPGADSVHTFRKVLEIEPTKRRCEARLRVQSRAHSETGGDV